MPRNRPNKPTTGRYGESIRRVSLNRRYLEQMSAPDWISLRDETALVTSKINELLAKIDTNGVDFLALSAIYQELLAYIANDDMPAVAISAEQMGEIIEKGIAEALIWKDLYQAIEQRRKLVETEMKTLNSIGAMLSMEQVMTLVGKLISTITLHIQDKGTLTAIHNDFSRVLDLVPNKVNDDFSDFSEDK